jgi:CRP-like cAMP-binding protein
MIAHVTIRGVFKNARTTRTLSPDEILFSAGDAGDNMYGVISGAVELRRGEHVVQRIAMDVMRSLSRLIHELSGEV